MSDIQNNNVQADEIQPRLQYNYCKINLTTGECIFCATYSYEIPLANYIEVPEATDDYQGKFYNQADGLWYWDSAFTQLWEEAPTWN